MVVESDADHVGRAGFQGRRRNRKPRRLVDPVSVVRRKSPDAAEQLPVPKYLRRIVDPFDRKRQFLGFPLGGHVNLAPIPRDAVMRRELAAKLILPDARDFDRLPPDLRRTRALEFHSSLGHVSAGRPVDRIREHLTELGALEVSRMSKRRVEDATSRGRRVRPGDRLRFGMPSARPFITTIEPLRNGAFLYSDPPVGNSTSRHAAKNGLSRPGWRRGFRECLRLVSKWLW